MYGGFSTEHTRWGDHGRARGKYQKWGLQYHAREELRDIDTVLNYFDGMRGYYSLSESIEHSLERGISSKIQSEYFTVTVYKKGTIHLTFNDDDILRRFNVAACLGKNFLPHDYGRKAYQECTEEEKAVIDSFEGEASYNNNLGLPLFAVNNNLPLLAA